MPIPFELINAVKAMFNVKLVGLVLANFTPKKNQ